MPTKDDFRRELCRHLQEASECGASALTISSGALHRALGGYPGIHHQMATCCDAMNEEIREGDQMISAPGSSRGPLLLIRYQLPR